MTTIEEIRRKLYKQMFTNEYEYLQNTADQHDNLPISIKCKTSRIDSGKCKTSHTDSNNPTTLESDNFSRISQLQKIIENFETVEEINRSGIDKMFAEIDKYMYKKRWNKLKDVHRIVKLKEYAAQSSKVPDADRQRVSEVIVKNVRNLSKKNTVIYDPAEECIVSIPALKYNIESKQYYV